MEKQRFFSREDPGITEFLVETAKIRSLKLFSNITKNGGPLYGKISAQPHTIVKQTCFPNGNVLF